MNLARKQLFPERYVCVFWRPYIYAATNPFLGSQAITLIMRVKERKDWSEQYGCAWVPNTKWVHIVHSSKVRKITRRKSTFPSCARSRVVPRLSPGWGPMVFPTKMWFCPFSFPGDREVFDPFSAQYDSANSGGTSLQLYKETSPGKREPQHSEVSGKTLKIEHQYS